ncbi:MAG: type IV secretory system conjugative DNA transfer family protein [Sphingomonadales bacterium]
MARPVRFHPPRGYGEGLQLDPLATSRWQTGGEIADALAYDPNKEDRIILGFREGKRRNTYLGVPIDDRHLVTIAGARSGKGTSSIVPNLLFYTGSVIANDPKGELARITAKHRAAKLGQQIAIIDPFLDSGVPEGDLAAFNPLDIIDPEDENAIDEAGLLADALVVQETGSGQHWTMAARNFLHGVILYVALECIGRERTLPHVRELITQDDEGFNDLLSRMVETGGYCAQVANSIASKSDNERSSVISTAVEQTSFLASPAMMRGLGTSTFDMDALKTSAKGLTVYLCLPARRLAKHKRFLRLLLMVALSRMEAVPNVSVTQATANGKPVLFMLDEFPVLGHMDVIETAAGLMAGYGVKLWTILQDISQLQRDYPKSWQTFLGNTGLVLNFGSTDEATCAYMAKLCGETETLSASLPELSERERGAGKIGLNQSVTVAPLLRPDEIRREFARDGGWAIVFQPGKHPMPVRRANYFDSQHKAIFGGKYD